LAQVGYAPAYGYGYYGSPYYGAGYGYGPYAYSGYYAPGPLAIGADIVGGALDLGWDAATAPFGGWGGWGGWGGGWGSPGYASSDYGYSPYYGAAGYGYSPAYSYWDEYNGKVPESVAEKVRRAHHYPRYAQYYGYHHHLAHFIKKNSVAHLVRQAHNY
jgi:hypothetical protein